MESSIPKYEGKPTAYLDHNILDFFVDNPNSDFKKVLKEKFQTIFSDENLKEIMRTGEKGHLYLKVLQDLDALYLKLVLTPKFEVTGDATLTINNPFEVFESYCENIHPVYEQIERSSYQSVLKFYGGRSEDDFDDINNEQIGTFNDLLRITATVNTEFCEA